MFLAVLACHPLQQVLLNQVVSLDVLKHSISSFFHLYRGLGRSCFIPMVVLEMLRWRCPAVLILCTLLVQWNGQLKHDIDPWFQPCTSNFVLW